MLIKIYFRLKKVGEVGIFNKLIKTEFPSLSVGTTISTYSSVGIKHVESAFLIILLGVFISFVFLLLECVCRLLQNKTKHVSANRF